MAENTFSAEGYTVSLDALNAELQFFLSQNEGIEITETNPADLLELIYDWLVYTGITSEDFEGFVEMLSEDWGGHDNSSSSQASG